MWKEIVDKLEKRIPFLWGLTKIRLFNLRIKHKNAQVENVELDETLFNKIKEGDTIFCDFDSHDIWLKLTINIKSSAKSITS